LAESLEIHPALRRDIDLLPVQGEDGGQMIMVHDPLELSGQGSVALRAESLPVLSMLDGAHSLEEIRLHLVAQTARAGSLTSIPREVVESFVDQLDRIFLLDNLRYREARQRLIEQFSRLRVRPAALAGRSYPGEKKALEEFLDTVVLSGGESEAAGALKGRDIAALVAPHIELRTGARLYAASYGALKGRSFDRVVILGVGHNLETGFFSVTSKDFATPLGTVTTDQVAAMGFRDAAGPLNAPDDFVHRGEHSIEFQILCLQRVLKGPFTIVPILCGSLYQPLIVDGVDRPRSVPGLSPALDYLTTLLANPSRKTLIVAGVDFSHVGPKFGDSLPAVRITRDSTVLDKALLACLVRRDVEGFCTANRLVKDSYHVCGFSALALLLEVLPGKAAGVELGHQVWHETPTQSAVSFASAAFYLP
jgi:MEMO1 family protein